MPDQDREHLAETQAKLIGALTAGAKVPDGFDDARVRLTARTLISKRRQAVAKLWPGLAEALGERFAERFAAYAEKRSMPNAGHGADGRGFAEDLLTTDELSDSGRIALLLDRARVGWVLRWIRLRERGRWGVAVRVWGRVWWGVLPI